MDNGSPTSWLPSTSSRSSSRASSKTLSINRNSSPTKQLRNAEPKETEFIRADLRDDPKPRSLDALTTGLERIVGGFEIFPGDLQDDLADEPSVVAWNFGDSVDFEKSQLPDIRTVQKVYNLESRCFQNNHPKSFWNNDVHSRILNWILRDSPAEDDLVDYRCCPTAQIIPEYQPCKPSSKMVDFCICIQPERNSPHYQAIQSLCKYRPTMSINHTDWAVLTKYPIAVSIETKGLNGVVLASSGKIEFLPGIVVMQHHWCFMATALNQSGKAQTFERLPLWETESILGIYKLFISLQRLINWTKDQYWVAFQTSVIGL
ncbi:uncharacterized protein BDV14DRAFT_208747 [Aspergillus stella-maris]|uniref:uncharacterized protein n=1 Tax=Aspergillus stella-maris TaxID=1810926 RepID=UPI003CCD1AF3